MLEVGVRFVFTSPAAKISNLTGRPLAKLCPTSSWVHRPFVQSGSRDVQKIGAQNIAPYMHELPQYYSISVLLLLWSLLLSYIVCWAPAKWTVMSSSVCTAFFFSDWVGFLPQHPLSFLFCFQMNTLLFIYFPFIITYSSIFLVAMID